MGNQAPGARTSWNTVSATVPDSRTVRVPSRFRDRFLAGRARRSRATANEGRDLDSAHVTRYPSLSVSSDRPEYPARVRPTVSVVRVVCTDFGHLPAFAPPSRFAARKIVLGELAPTDSRSAACGWPGDRETNVAHCFDGCADETARLPRTTVPLCCTGHLY